MSERLTIRTAFVDAPTARRLAETVIATAEPFEIAERGRYALSTAPPAAGLTRAAEELCGELFGTPGGVVDHRWTVHRAGDYALSADSAAHATTHHDTSWVEAIIDLSEEAAEEGEVHYQTARWAERVPQTPGSIALLRVDRSVVSFVRYLTHTHSPDRVNVRLWLRIRLVDSGEALTSRKSATG